MSDYVPKMVYCHGCSEAGDGGCAIYHAPPTCTPPPASGPDCAVSPWSSRGCERGTAGCEVKHAAAPAVEPARPTFPGSVAIHPDAVRAPYVASAQATITSAAPPEGGRGEQWKKVCASPLFHFLKREDGRRILELLVAGKISFGKAAQSIVEAYELGVTPLLPPDNPATITLPREEWEAHQDAVALLTGGFVALLYFCLSFHLERIAERGQRDER
jgi:hypothetical protein